MASDKGVDELEKQFGVKILRCVITGKRWKFTGERVSNFSVAAPYKIIVNEKEGFVVYGWEKLTSAHKGIIERRLKNTDEY
ncbi:hypothetical protein QA601_09470 [Chitinispirillales bacterium ANBcel5]|uniref:hypothetical protein n=1 Tax=Cellulosispirillum alkaliphilum TaxID=3039283 RepID=UPI002A5926DA|nr:hypothetical protein [Chitinispirillales bacterium ANBcel5]